MHNPSARSSGLVLAKITSGPSARVSSATTEIPSQRGRSIRADSIGGLDLLHSADLDSHASTSFADPGSKDWLHYGANLPELTTLPLTQQFRYYEMPAYMATARQRRRAAERHRLLPPTTRSCTAKTPSPRMTDTQCVPSTGQQNHLSGLCRFMTALLHQELRLSPGYPAGQAQLGHLHPAVRAPATPPLGYQPINRRADGRAPMVHCPSGRPARRTLSGWSR